MKLLDGVTTQKTEYLYNKTEQVAKTVTDLVNSRIESETIMEYNAQGRMAKITIMTYVDGSLAKIVTQEYEYDSSGIKVKQAETVDADADGTIDSGKITEYLNVKQNHTGYSQVPEEYLSEDGAPVKVTTYTIGHDVLTQANALYGILTLLADGHGSTRAVADRSGAVLQQYSYDAYGNAHGFNPSEAMTNLLYSGEQFNPVSGLQYLRARWYNPQTGTFNRLDPYSGNRESPLSFHKYAYAHMNPIMGVDPSGEFFSVLLTLITIPVASIVAVKYGVAAGLILGGIIGYSAYSIYNSLAHGRAMNSSESTLFNNAMIFLKTNGYSYEYSLLSVYNIQVDTRSINDFAWGQNILYSVNISHESFGLGLEYFASLLIHEINHSLKLAPYEAESYRLAEAFLIAHQPNRTPTTLEMRYIEDHRYYYRYYTNKESQVRS